MKTKNLKITNLLYILVITAIVSILFFGLFELLYSFDLDFPLGRLSFFGDKYYYSLGIFPKEINISHQMMLVAIVLSYLSFLVTDSFISFEKEEELKEKLHSAFSIGLIFGLVFGFIFKLIPSVFIGGLVSSLMLLFYSYKRGIVHFSGMVIGSVVMSFMSGVFLIMAIWLSFNIKTKWLNYKKRKGLQNSSFYFKLLIYVIIK